MSTWTPERLSDLYRFRAQIDGECICPPEGPCYSATGEYTPCLLCSNWPTVAPCPKATDGGIR